MNNALANVNVFSTKKRVFHFRPGVVEHTCNLTHLGDRRMRIAVGDQLGQRILVYNYFQASGLEDWLLYGANLVE
jgi:hypothetical protein